MPTSTHSTYFFLLMFCILVNLIFLYNVIKYLFFYGVTRRQRSNHVEEFAAAVTTGLRTQPNSNRVTKSAIIEVVIDVIEEGIKTPAIKGKNTDCSICIAETKYREISLILPICGHKFHKACIEPWLKEKKTCPLCRTRVRDGRIIEETIKTYSPVISVETFTQ